MTDEILTFEASVGIKNEIVLNKFEKQIVQYRQAIDKINFPFIPRFLKSFQNSFCVFVLSALPNGIIFEEFL